MIRVDAICKTYRLWDSPLSRLLLPMAYWFVRPAFPDRYQRLYDQYCTEVQALKDVSFELNQGDSLGIVGLNGSGKSTLLQIIAGTLGASSGHVEISGRVAALLELGSGFDPEFTGRENVFLNAAILGLDHRMTEVRYDDIVAFADIGDSIDRPVKTYSSGMLVRLAFSVQVHVDPDILIIDEALAVGDARFQIKALNKIDEIMNCGTTLLFVGHDLNTIRSFCHRAIFLHEGRVRSAGVPDDVINDYLQLIQSHQVENQKVEQKRVHKGFSIGGYGVTRASIKGFGEHAEVHYDQEIEINIELGLGQSVDVPVFILDIVDQKGLQLSGQRIPIPRGSNTVKSLTIRLRCTFQRGLYRFRLRMVDAPSLEQTRLLSKQDDLLSLEIVDDVREKFTGLFPIPMTSEWN